MLAPVSMSPPIFGSPTLPAPTTRQCFPASFINIGNRLVTVPSGQLHKASRSNGTRCRHLAGDRVHSFASQKLPQFRVRVPGKELPQVLTRRTRREIMPQQSLNRIRNLGRKAAISHGSRRRLMQTERSAKAEVIGVDESPIDLHFFAVDADVGNPVLSATVRASRNVQFQV